MENEIEMMLQRHVELKVRSTLFKISMDADILHYYTDVPLMMMMMMVM